MQNIYDIAVNVWEWTLEFYNDSYPCVYRGCSYVRNILTNPAKHAYNVYTGYYNDDVGFRIALWK